MMKKIICFLVFIVLSACKLLFALPVDSMVVIKLKGSVFEKENNRPVNTVMIVNKRTQQGFYSGSNSFEVKLFSNDTLLIGSTGFITFPICFKDSVLKEEYTVTFFVSKLLFQAKEVEVFGARDLDRIQQDIEKIGYNKSDFILSDIDALNSPITFLYQQFSRKEKAKRKLAELKNNDLKRALLKELLARYVTSELMELETTQFDGFIDYCNVSDDFMKSSSQYEFILFIKKKYEIYKIMKTENKR